VSRSRDATVIRNLCHWFSHAARDLPWRTRRTGYTALVSEAMLQQTQVSRVIEKYRAFLKRFPSIRALAAAQEQDVLAAWQGLGYYRRARHLRAAAQHIMQQHRGRVPRDVKALQTLPGVGRYTAGAIASIVFGQPEPIVDGNVQRVLARLDADEQFDAAHAWSRAAQLVQQAPQPGVFNEAMMELGATVCLPRQPLCASCPLKRSCRAYRAGVQDQLPPPKAATARIAVHHHAVVVMRSSKILLQQRDADGLWANMWQVPTIEHDQPLDDAALIDALPVAVTHLQHIGEFQHVLSHRTITFHVHRARSRSRAGHWRGLDDLAEVPLSNAQHRVLQLALENSHQC
jgi:A/G-specific adenine glycosylase